MVGECRCCDKAKVGVKEDMKAGVRGRRRQGEEEEGEWLCAGEWW